MTLPRTIVNDSHVHMGYFPRLNAADPYYYSPRRILTALNSANVDEFIISSTNAIWDKTGTIMHSEAKEMKRIAGARAHIFFWISDIYLKHDYNLVKLPELYEGFKLHGGETPWLRYPQKLKRILAIAKERSFPIQIHTEMDSGSEKNSIQNYLPYCKMFPELKFDLAHGQAAEFVMDVLKQAPNVWIDTAFITEKVIQYWLDSGVDEKRILFGSDIPAPQRHWNISMSSYLRKTITKINSGNILQNNFYRFLTKN